MRMFPLTKILMISALITANISPAKRASAQSCPDPNCCKKCGAISLRYQFTRSCSAGTCWVTQCSFTSNYCTPGIIETYNDICQTSQIWYCFPN